MNGLVLLLLIALPAFVSAQEGPREMTPGELENYEFEIEESQVTVSDLSLGQRYVLSTQRREIEDLIARRLGILSLKGDRSDLKVMQDLVERKVLRETREWQSLGIVFGDILAAEFDLHWISYEDELGISKALKWQKTENYVFPVTLFSKRIQFNEKINVLAVFEKIEADVSSFKAFEKGRPVFK
ncbi:MAG: DUF3806 domain-containing protein [Gammaproteobacteria bacterium]|jgi:hypothetical protein|nr:DUF3806 domain-containing protein [Gammaproteobacteria bacterium]MBT7369044.1 DUF3806 domain-containing protein [Gammaproteobacteria bacterium]